MDGRHRRRGEDNEAAKNGKEAVARLWGRPARGPPVLSDPAPFSPLPPAYSPRHAQANSLEQKKAELRPGTYVRAYGSIKNFQGHRISAFSVRPVHDVNELPYHNLQASFQHLHLLKGGGTGVGAVRGVGLR